MDDIVLGSFLIRCMHVIPANTLEKDGLYNNYIIQYPGYNSRILRALYMHIFAVEHLFTCFLFNATT